MSGIYNCSSLEHTSLVSKTTQTVSRHTVNTTKKQDNVDSSIGRTESASTTQEVNPTGMQIIRGSLTARGISGKAAEIITQSWREGTKQQYSVYLRKWCSFCSTRGIDPYKADIPQALDFMAGLFEQGLGYSAMNTVRSALSQVLQTPSGVSFGELPLVKQFMRGVYQEKPALPRYTTTWDVSILLKYLKTLPHVKSLSLKLLTFKTVTMLAILSAQRVQTLQYLDLRNMDLSENIVKFSIGDKLKQTKPGKHIKELEFPAYPTEPNLCVVQLVKEYITRTKPLRDKITVLFITVAKPHRVASKDTISRWIKTTLGLAGIDLTRFKPHSVRSASSSSAAQAKVPVETILKTAGWSTQCTFAKFYNKPMRKQGELALALLDSAL